MTGTTEKTAGFNNSPEEKGASGKSASEIKEKLSKIIFAVCAAFSVVAVFAIVFYIFYASFPAFRDIGFFNFIFGSTWAPRNELLSDGEKYGIFPMIIGSVAVTAGAILIGGAFGVFTAIFMAYYCPKKIKAFFVQIINLLAGIPSLIYGFFGLIALVPLLQRIFGVDNGKGLLAGSLILGLMILPTVASVSKNSLEAVPKGYYEGSLALGASRHQAIFCICVPAARKGIISSLILGVGRAVGETMAVMMVIGNSPNYPTGAFVFLRTLTTNIVTEMGYAEGLHLNALIATGFVLLLFVLIINFSIAAISKDKVRDKRGARVLKENNAPSSSAFVRRGIAQKILVVAAVFCAVTVIIALGTVVVYTFVVGIPNLSLQLLFGKSGNAYQSLRPAFVSTGMLILLSLAIALPIGIGSAIFLNEYAKKGSKFVKVVRLFTDTLSGIPSIVFGLFGQIFFCEMFGWGYSLLSGSFTLALIILPTIIRSTEQSLSEIPDSMREGSLALGASKVRTIFKVVLPSAISGIVTAIILSVGRIVGESAALIYTAGNVPYMPESYMDPGSSFAVAMYTFTSEGLRIGDAWATAAVLMVLIIIINILVSVCEKKLRKKL